MTKLSLPAASRPPLQKTQGWGTPVFVIGKKEQPKTKAGLPAMKRQKTDQGKNKSGNQRLRPLSHKVSGDQLGDIITTGSHQLSVRQKIVRRVFTVCCQLS